MQCLPLPVNVKYTQNIVPVCLCNLENVFNFMCYVSNYSILII